ncbi:MAG: ornithine cyclodeaminase family protein [Chromatiales bacterium]|nr:MAG: ornithine cyclodeaminase family protein [Chromatiales bacterium]
MRIRAIGEELIRELLTPAAAIDVVDAAMREVSQGNVELPLRWGLKLPNGAMGMMPGYLGSPECFGIKLVSLFPGNPAAGLPSHLGLMVLFEAGRGEPTALLDGDVITSLRTAAASAVATRALAREDASEVLICGTGAQARAHAPAMLAVRNIRRIRIWGRDADKAVALADELAQQHPLVVEPCTDLQDGVQTADIVCTVTGAREPIVRGEWLQPGTHLNLVGSSVPEAREVDTDAVRRANFFVDYRGSAFAQAGELLTAITAGAVDEDHVRAEIGEVLLGQAPGRTDGQEITVYKSLGVAAQDLAAAWYLYQTAESRGLGSVVEL